MVKFAPILGSCDIETDMDPACWLVCVVHVMMYIADVLCTLYTDHEDHDRGRIMIGS